MPDENEFRGIDVERLGSNNKIKSHWRHVRSRFYFTSASHMYTLLNLIIFGLKKNKMMLDKDKGDPIEMLEEFLRMDFLSGMNFRVFENLSKEDNDKNRFKLEIRV